MSIMKVMKLNYEIQVIEVFFPQNVWLTMCFQQIVINMEMDVLDSSFLVSHLHTQLIWSNWVELYDHVINSDKGFGMLTCSNSFKAYMNTNVV